MHLSLLNHTWVVFCSHAMNEWPTWNYLSLHKRVPSTLPFGLFNFPQYNFYTHQKAYIKACQRSFSSNSYFLPIHSNALSTVVSLWVQLGDLIQLLQTETQGEGGEIKDIDYYIHVELKYLGFMSPFICPVKFYLYLLTSLTHFLTTLLFCLCCNRRLPSSLVDLMCVRAVKRS